MSETAIVSVLSNSEGSVTLKQNQIDIEGASYRYVNGFLSKESGKRIIAMEKLLSVSQITARSKKLMFSFVLVGALISALLAVIENIRYLLTDKNVVSVIRFVERNHDTGAIRLGMETGAVIFVLVILLSYILLAFFLFSRRRYLELSFIGGVVRFKLAGIKKQEAEQFIRSVYNVKSRKGK